MKQFINKKNAETTDRRLQQRLTMLTAAFAGTLSVSAQEDNEWCAAL